MLSPGVAFAHYRIESLLGKGGMGEVYLAFDEKLQRQVALKVLLASEAADVQRMVREGRAAAALEHPNKVTVFELGDVDGTPYLAMELIRGTTFRSMVDDPSIVWQDALAYLLDVARALDAAHAARLIHRDIKPDNVMLREDGIVKVLDFGIARRSVGAIDPAAPTATATGGLIVGTAAYMAPEQIRGDDLDGRCDEFAWGVTAFELFTGEHPWGMGRDALQLMSTMLTKPPRALADLRPDLPKSLSDAIARTLSPERDARFATMHDLVSELAPLIGQNERGHVRITPSTRSVESALAETVAAPAIVSTTKPAVGAAKSPPKREAIGRWAIGIALIAAGASAFLFNAIGKHRQGTDDAAPARATTAEGTVVAADINPPKPPLRYRCHPDLQERTERGLVSVHCDDGGEGSFLWCDSHDRQIACCAEGLVAAGHDGMCMCPPRSDDKGRARGCTDSPTAAPRVQSEIDARMKTTKARVLACFQGNGSGPKRSWRIHFWVDFSPEGEAASVKILKSDAPNQEMQACALRELRGMRTFASAGGLGAAEMEWELGDTPPPAQAASANP